MQNGAESTHSINTGLSRVIKAQNWVEHIKREDGKTKISEVERQSGPMNPTQGGGQKVGEKRKAYKLTEKKKKKSST